MFPAPVSLLHVNNLCLIILDNFLCFYKAVFLFESHAFLMKKNLSQGPWPVKCACPDAAVAGTVDN